MALSPSLFSSNSDEWRTPDPLFNFLNGLYDFTLDAAATISNTRCPDFFSTANSALTNDWSGRVWCNPPYSRGKCDEFVTKAYTEVMLEGNAEMACVLLPARTDTKLWHTMIFPMASEIIFLKGRLKFMDINGLTSNSAPFPSALVIYTGDGEFSSTSLGTLEANPSGPGTRIKYWS